jgi:ferredoxin
MNMTRPHTDTGLRIRIATQRCQGHNRCHMIAPDLFDVDDFGQARLRPGVALTPALCERARLAAANCPEFAIVLEDGVREAGAAT